MPNPSYFFVLKDNQSLFVFFLHVFLLFHSSKRNNESPFISLARTSCQHVRLSKCLNFQGTSSINKNQFVQLTQPTSHLSVQTFFCTLNVSVQNPSALLCLSYIRLWKTPEDLSHSSAPTHLLQNFQ